ncbi:M56 family metallopeptidase [Paenibacillus qinlingensis]|uniref:Bla regulator protein BlaR1 n=1 Tax=Paenibacillus qinlingensis TaxID=1837343 RepID=A0ABU1P4R1_9BACL|nr:M56 family metallopeptidase [Paenibacillus qinlingensis]MDR6554733.1 bla regulator protein BlaR1 [Paenibacillus qinlingensis]
MSRISEVFTGLFGWIISVSLMATITVVFILLIQRILHKRIKPRWHYLMWLLVLVRLLLPWNLESNLSIYNWISYPGSVHEIDSVVDISMHEEFEDSGAAENLMYKYAMSIWLLGIVLFAIYTVVINRKFTLKIKKETSPIADIGILHLFAQCQQLMSIHKPVTLVVSDKISMPTLFGVRKPWLIIPQTVLNSLNEEQLRHVFLHELAHCKRNDIGVNWLMQVMLTIHWFNPILWYAHQRMREDQEIASDALALSYLEPAKRENYGYTLIQLLESYVRPVSVPGNVHLSGNKSQLKRRIIMIKQFQFNSYRWSFLGLAAVLIISGCSLTNASVDKKTASESNPPIVDQKTTETSSLTTGTNTNTNTSVDKSSETKVADTVTPATPTVESSPAPTRTPAPAQVVEGSRSEAAAAQATEGSRLVPTAAPAAERTRTAPAAAPAVERSRAAAQAAEGSRTVPTAIPAVRELTATPTAAPVAE